MRTVENTREPIRPGRFPIPIALCCLLWGPSIHTAAAAVTITANAPVYNFQVLPGSTRQISVLTTGGTLNTINWSVLSANGGASATFTTPAGAGVSTVNAGLPTVQVNIGSKAGNCVIPQASTAIGTYTVTSSVNLTVRAQSVDDPTRTATFLFNVCAKTTTVMVAPAYQQAFKGQHRMLQSWVSGDTDETGVWSIVSEPSGGDGTLADTTNRDADFVATETGRYTLKYTSNSDPAKNATAIVYVSPNPFPAYAATPNGTEPRECFVDPALTGGDYEVGPGKPFATIQSTPDAGTLEPGSIIRVWNTDTTGSNPSTYHEYYQIHNAGTPTQPMILCGVPDARGNLPVLDGANATAQAGVSTGAAAGYGLVSIWAGGYGNSTPYGYWPSGSAGPSYVSVTGLHLVHGTPDYTYTPPGGGAATPYVVGASCINVRSGSYLDLGGNDIDTCTNGIFTAENANSAWANISQLVTITGNHIHQSGYKTDDTEHQIYFQSYYGLMQGNLINDYVSTAAGSDIKWRGVEGIFRYNFVGSGTARNFDLVENQDAPNYETFEDYLGAPGANNCDFSLYCLGDTAGPNILAAYQESAQKDFLYGNEIQGAPGGQIHYAEDNLGSMADRNGTLYFFNNTLDNAQAVFDTGQNGDGFNSVLVARIDARNNILWAQGPVIQIGRYASIILAATTNLMKTGSFSIATPIEGTPYGYFNSGLGDGWANYCDGTCYWNLTVPLDPHLYGLSNANYLASSTQPYDPTNFVPVSGSSAIGAGSALTGMPATMPVRWQFSPVTNSLLPRQQPLTIGAQDYQPVAATPTFNPPAGQYNVAQTVTIATTTPLAKIYYTTDGSAPTTTSKLYAGGVSVPATETLQAIAVATGYLASAPGSAAYSIGPPAATPTFNPPAGTYTSIQSVAIGTTTPLPTIYYTTDGTDPATSNTAVKYTTKITVSATETIKAVAEAAGFSNSAESLALYTINLPQAVTPIISLAAGVYPTAQPVTISDTTPGAVIHYTIDGTPPNANSSVYPASGITVSKTEQLQAIVVATGYTPSAAAIADYTIGVPVATHFTVSAPGKTIAGSSFAFTVTAVDVFNNTATSYSGTVHFTSSDGSATLPANATLSNGTAGFNATLKTLGSQSITATDTVNNSITGTSASIAVVQSSYLVVTTAADDAGSASSCTPQAAPGTGTDAACSLRDALLFATASGNSESISFSSAVFKAANTAAQNTIQLSSTGLTIPAGTTITGPTSGSGNALSGLITIKGGGAASNFAVFTVNGTGSLIGYLTISNGNLAGSTGAFYLNYGATVTLQNCLVTSNFGGGIFDDYAAGVTLVNSSISGNTGTGIVLEGGASATLTASTISGNTSGAGIENLGGTVTLTASTISGNVTAEFASGGGIYSSGNVTVTSSTISGNTASYYGGGIYSSGGTLTLTNSVVAANTASANADVYGPYTDGGGNQASSNSSATSQIAIDLAPLGNYGGPTETMPPLPGSPALCSISPSSAGGTDQRGLPRTTTYGSTSCQDAGAVETSYALSFTTEPPVSAFSGQAFKPAPVVALTESGAPATAAAATVSMTDSASSLGGTTSAPLVSGSASFGNLIVNNTVGSDTLTAAIALTPALKLTTHSSAVSITVTGSTPQTITFGTLSNRVYSSTAQPLSATATSGLTVTFTSNSLNVCTVSGVSITLLSTGTCSITASQGGNSTYAPATPVIRAFTVTSAGPPALVSLSPSSGTGTQVTFKAVYSDPNSANDLSELLLQINSVQSSANACYVYYQPQGNHLYLAANAGAWITPALTPGVAGSVSNSQCTLNAGSSSVTAAGNNLALNVALTFSNAFVGTKNVYLYAAGLSGQSSGWVKEGTWVPTSAGPPAIVSLSPNSGTGVSGTFKAIYSDPNGAGDLNEVLLQINSVQSSANACYVYYQPQGNHLYLANNSGVWITPSLTPGVAGTASNSQCTLNGGSSSVTTAGNDLTLSVALSFISTFAGSKNVYLYAAGYSGQNSGWIKEGTWVPASAGPPAIVSLSPNSGTGTSVTFKAIYSDPNGAADLSTLLLQINASQSSGNACYVYYQPQGNHLYLANNAGVWITPALTPGVAGTAANSQCTLNAGTSSVTTAGNDLTLNVAISFSGGFVGAKNVYLYAAGLSGKISGWVNGGAWNP
jgi:Chitobiase/beta-hexosaminidase C-terminal domain/Right handed beta helix region